MNIYDANIRGVEPVTGKRTAVLHQANNFKIRIVELPPGGNIPPCEMADSAMFHVLSGSANITVNSEIATVGEGQGIATGPATVSMTSKHGARLLGIQIQTSGPGEADG